LVIQDPGSVNKNCWEYLPDNNEWILFSTMNFEHERYPGKLVNNRFFILSGRDQKEVLDLETNTWSGWPQSTINIGVVSSMVVWNDILIVFGGGNASLSVQVRNTTNKFYLFCFC
jgi:hypothetical protein